MAEKLTPQPNMEYIRDLLSPYLDDEVTDEERAQVDAALAGSPELRDELESLRQTVALVANLPRIPAPRPFTLTEADVQATAPKPKKPFTLPSWLGGFAAAAALLACVLALGGLFLTDQFSRGGLVGDIAMAPQQAAEQPAAPAEETPAEEQAPPPEEEAETEMGLLMETDEAEGEVEQELARETVVEEKAVEATSPVALSAQATDAAADSSSRVDADRSGTGADGVGGQALPTPTAMATTAPSPALAPPPPAAEQAENTADTAAAAEEPAVAEQPAEAEEFAAAEAAPAEPDDIARKEGEALQLLKIQNQVLRLGPGLIYLAGTLEVDEGTVLAANLQRNGEPFSEWAEPASLQTTVAANGRFEFNIVAAEPATADLFEQELLKQELLKQELLKQEPAAYQIIITSPSPNTAVIAFAHFDTLAPVAATATSTAASTPSPTVSPTPFPSNTPAIEVTPIPARPVRTSLFVGTVVAVSLVLLVAAGLLIWFIRRNK